MKLSRWTIGAAALAVLLVVNLVIAAGVDPDRDNPEGAGPDFTPYPPIGSEVEDFSGREVPGRFESLDIAWQAKGPLALEEGVLMASASATLSTKLPSVDRVVQVNLVDPAAGWTVAFAFTDPSEYWGVDLARGIASLVHVHDGVRDVIATKGQVTPYWVEVLLTIRDGQIVLRSGGNLLFSGKLRPGQDVPGFALIAKSKVEAGVDSVAFRRLGA